MQLGAGNVKLYDLVEHELRRLWVLIRTTNFSPYEIFLATKIYYNNTFVFTEQLLKGVLDCKLCYRTEETESTAQTTIKRVAINIIEGEEMIDSYFGVGDGIG